MEPSVNSIDNALDPGHGLRVERAAQIVSPRSQWQIFTVVLLLVDVLMIGLGFWIAHLVRFNTYLPIFQLDAPPSLPFYRTVSLTLIPLWLAIFALSGLYQRRNLLGGTLEYSLLFRAISIGMILVIVAGFLQPDFVLARAWLLLAWTFTFFFVASGRFVLRRVIYSLRRRGYFLTPALIVGANAEGRSVAEQLISWRTSGLHVVGFVDDEVPLGTAVYGSLYSLGNVTHLDQLIGRYNVEEIIIATSALSRDEMLTVFKRFGLRDGLNLRLSSGLFEIITTGLEVKEMADTPLVRVQKVRLTGIDRAMKLALDYLITIPGLIAISPLLLMIAIAIKLDSPGPVIYRRQVMGINGRPFGAYKFRTMHVNSDRILAGYPDLQAELARTHKLRRDPRVTRMGNILRKSSLDELPQLLNVIKREMSLVGPRMISPGELKMYDAWGLNLLTVPPGITGLWQVSGRSDISYQERVRLDMYYIRNWTIWLDIQLLLQTIPAVIRGQGAY